jgi:hypothetical protein
MDIQNGDYFRADDKGQFFNGRSRTVEAHFFTATYYVRDDKGNVVGEKDQELIQETIAGDKTLAPVMKATDWHREKYAAEYAAFREGKSAQSQGTRLEDWAGVSAAQVKSLQYHNVFTVEALAALPDFALSQVGMGARDLKNKAAAWLERRRELKTADAEAEETAKLRRELALLREQIARPAEPGEQASGVGSHKSGEKSQKAGSR